MFSTPVIDPPVISTLPLISFVIVTAVLVKLAAPMLDAEPLMVMLSAEMLSVTVIDWAAIDVLEFNVPITVKSPLTWAEVLVMASAPIVLALPVTLILSAAKVVAVTVPETVRSPVRVAVVLVMASAPMTKPSRLL